MKGVEKRLIREVPRASMRRNRPVSPWNRTADIVDQKKALRPNAARGNAVAVPRCSGKFVAAIVISCVFWVQATVVDAPVLIEAPKAEQLPKPVRKEKNDMKKTPIEP